MLNVNDKVYTETQHNGKLRYRVYTVERLTNTLAIISNGSKLKNMPKQYGCNTPFYQAQGGDSNAYFLLTNAAEKKIDKWEFETKIEAWYNTFKPTIEQMTKIYNLINQTP